MTVILVIILGYVIKHTLIHPNHLTDNLYNKGVILRSTTARPGILLETSYLHWYFEVSDIVRPEDWHRSLSLVIQRYFAQVSHGNELVTRLPHLLWTLLWLSAAGRIYSAINRYTASGPGHLAICGLALTIAILVFNKWSVEILSGAYMDDVPGAAFALLGILALMSPSPTSKNIAISAMMFGMAFLAKDINLVWGIIGFLLVVIYILFSSIEKTPRAILSKLILYVSILLLVYGIKIAWNLHDLGTPLATAARTALNARLLPGIQDGEHFLFIMHDKKVPGYLDIAQTVGWSAILKPGLTNLLWFLIDQIYTFALLVFSLALWLLEKNRKTVNLFLLYTLTATGVYAIFFAFQLGEPAQTRYWLAPFSMMVIAFVSSITPTPNAPSPLPLRAIKTSMVLAICLFAIRLAPDIIQEQKTVYSHAKPYNKQIYERISETVKPGESVLTHTNQGVLIWSRFPYMKVVAVKPHHLTTLNEEEFKQMRDKYNITTIVFSTEDNLDGLFDLLRKTGFKTLNEFSPDVIFIYE
ncbi:MAG: hypothetical protein N2117_02465 [Anaerolineales bacterium]|nr:hypothetical protein [Anaerolineales bacterium]MCX7754096.1 hypothetical protein [Anaerolineales bacterium]MDW8278821.1 hypothetical protein [Anaerolineales bacterium]